MMIWYSPSGTWRGTRQRPFWPCHGPIEKSYSRSCLMASGVPGWQKAHFVPQSRGQPSFLQPVHPLQGLKQECLTCWRRVAESVDEGAFGDSRSITFIFVHLLTSPEALLSSLAEARHRSMPTAQKKVGTSRHDGAEPCLLEGRLISFWTETVGHCTSPRRRRHVIHAELLNVLM